MSSLHSPEVAMRTYPLSGIFAPFPFVCFTLTFITDIIYWQTSFLMWQNFSSWLLFFGEIGGALALIAGAIDLARKDTRDTRPGWSATIAFVGVLLLAILNSFIHAGDGWTAVVPYGLLVSAATIVAMILTVWLTIEHRYGLPWRMP
ncbi:DUF2231 domain-containing protein [Peteryoungia desertarenae]|uniref:DUF2231 domain-containing protein n=1 Tax=Peteryoungia desertarenae TaxID=1813451 RepID=A0ABX6QP13_9HYPH|nr:DUF2231 domain-containing protein [Peteryoungia desertarenae]QLF70250.1 DUF2231 domain-containing protein [Peteryoungia desertarenae]